MPACQSPDRRCQRSRGSSRFWSSRLTSSSLRRASARRERSECGMHGALRCTPLGCICFRCRLSLGSVLLLSLYSPFLSRSTSVALFLLFLPALCFFFLLFTCLLVLVCLSICYIDMCLFLSPFSPFSRLSRHTSTLTGVTFEN